MMNRTKRLRLRNAQWCHHPWKHEYGDHVHLTAYYPYAETDWRYPQPYPPTKIYGTRIKLMRQHIRDWRKGRA